MNLGHRITLLLFSVSLLILIGSFVHKHTSFDSQIDSEEDLWFKADSVLSQMTLEEKAGQMTNISLMALAKGDFWMHRDTVELDTLKMKELLLVKHVGSVQNLGTYPFPMEEWRQNISIIQKYVLKNSRIKIPLIYGIDAVHGANYSAGATLFPQQLALAASWNTELAETTGMITAYETKACGIPWNYAPVLDVSKQPLWGRIFESFGEDSYLASQMGMAILKGAQGDDISQFDKTAMCLKHYIGYGQPYNGKDRSPVYLPERMIRQIHLPPFESAIKAGALTVMLNSGSVNGVPSHADHYFITEVLKGELGFKGFTISDWEDVMNLVKTHQVAANEKEAVKLAVNAGLDMCMEPYDASFAEYLVELVREGEVPVSRINDAVRRILFVKFKLGLFDAYMEAESLYPDYGSEKFAQKSYEAARECITLLKNDHNILPLAESETMLLTGVAAHSLNYLNGAWSRTWSGEDTAYNDTGKKTIRDAIADKIGEDNLFYVQGTDYTKDINIKKAVKTAESVSKIVVVLGEKPATEKPSDIDELNMPDAQRTLVKALAKTGKPIVLVLVEARPRLIHDIESLADGIIMAYLPGNEGGRAIADVLFGDINPSGKLPITYPKYSGSIWAYDHTKSDTRDAGFGYDAFDPQYPFGFGLSYTSFNYENLQVDRDSFSGNENLHISVNVTNSGDRAGKEVVQLYSSDLVASIVPAVQQLRRFKKIKLQPGEMKTVTFSLSKDDLAFVDMQNQWITEKGEFTFRIDSLSKTVKYY